MKSVIRLGDSTNHGGVVVSASGTYTIMGKGVARVGDQVTCPIKGHPMAVIVEGDPNWLIDGRAVALDGHKTSCGASLIASLPNLGRG
ncbi:PAAR domain-containing protein [Oryzomicrobium sp.]|uniref:PAAR domain-containing protein n=1 Tax=Oryzomicrobium sp. TaxID=1911578 RepID=UPI002FE03E50